MEAKMYYHKLLLEHLVVILEGLLHKHFNCFPLTGHMQVQQLLERVCGEPHLLDHLLAVVVGCLLHGC